MDTMSLSSIALVGASAALAAVIFKDKDSRVNELLEFAKLPPKEIESSVHYKIIKNELNSYITGIRENSFHDYLLDIMARENKPIGYFCKLDSRLELKQPYFFNIKEITLFQSIRASFSSKMSNLNHVIHLVIFSLFICFSIEYGKSPNLYFQAFSVALSALAGFFLYNWFTVIALIWKQHPNSKDLEEYKALFEKYAKEKKTESLP
jgi:hypothetical protein